MIKMHKAVLIISYTWQNTEYKEYRSKVQLWMKIFIKIY